MAGQAHPQASGIKTPVQPNGLFTLHAKSNENDRKNHITTAAGRTDRMPGRVGRVATDTAGKNCRIAIQGNHARHIAQKPGLRGRIRRFLLERDRHHICH